MMMDSETHEAANAASAQVAGDELFVCPDRDDLGFVPSSR